MRPSILVVVLTLVAAGAGCRKGSVVEVEARSPAVVDGRLAEDIGLETLGGTFTPLLKRGALPSSVTETFGTATDNQRSVELRLFRGTAALVRDTKPLGRFGVTDLPDGPRGTVVVAMTLAVSSDGTITLAARESTGKPVRLIKTGP